MGVPAPDLRPQLLLDLPHLRVPRHLREDRCGGDHGEQVVRLVLRNDLQIKVQVGRDRSPEVELVHVRGVHVRDLRPQPGDDRREQLRLEVVQAHLRPHRIDLLCGDHEHLESADLPDLRREDLPPLRGELLRVPHVQPPQGDVGFHEDPRHDERADHRPTTRLIDPADHEFAPYSSDAISCTRSTTAASSTVVTAPPSTTTWPPTIVYRTSLPRHV